jgi:DNA-binding MarR family transcriptional regulator
MRLFELANCLGWEKSRLSHQVARMAERGLVEKRKCPSDRRGTFVALTTGGRERLKAAAPAQAAAVQRVFSAQLSCEQLSALASTCEALLAGAEGSAGCLADPAGERESAHYPSSEKGVVRSS